MAFDPEVADGRSAKEKSPVHVILCVDDNHLLLDIRAEVLERAGYVVLRAATADAALELFKTNKVDLVITDHLLEQGGTGTDLVASVRRLLPKVPVAIYSEMAESTDDAQRADAFISKGAGTTQMLVEVAKLLKL